MPQLDEQLPEFQLTSPDGARVAVDDLIAHGAVVLAAVEGEERDDPRTALLADLAGSLGGSRLVIVSTGPSELGSALAAGSGARWLQDPAGDAFAALGLVHRKLGRTRRLGGLFVVDAERRLRFAFSTADRNGWIPGSFVLSRLERLGVAITDVSVARDDGADGADGELVALVLALGGRLGMEAAELDELATATRLRDLGMASVPDEIITKDGPLHDDEWELIRDHPRRSAEMVDPGPAFDRIRETVHASHEHMDGSGYPRGLGGERIPLGARILLAAESYLAMTSEYPYGGILTPRQGLDRLRAEAGSIYDPAVVAALAAQTAAGLAA